MEKIIKKTWSGMTLNEKINFRGSCIPVYNNRNVNWAENLPAKGQSVGRLMMSLYRVELDRKTSFCCDVKVIALEPAEALFFSREGKEWVEIENIEEWTEAELYYCMALVGSLWCFYPTYLDAEEERAKLDEHRETYNKIMGP